MNLKICLFALGLLSVSVIAAVTVKNVVSEPQPSETPAPAPALSETAPEPPATKQMADETQPLKQHRFLLMATSYKRPLLLSGQILRFMNQTYKNFFLSVSVKGTEEDKIRATFMKEWEPFIQENRLLIRFNKNGEQLSNLLDAARDLPLDEYDYFCKVDDDDWYAPNYLEDVNKWLNKQKNVDLSFTTNMFILENVQDSTKMYRSPLDWNGPTICMSRKILDALFTLEKDPSAYNDILPTEQVKWLKRSHEDNLIHKLTTKLKGVFQYRKTPATDLIYGRQYPSITNPTPPH